MSVTSSPNCIELSDVTYRIHDNVILDNITFSVKQGEYLGIIGPNGGGKTTLLKIILGLIAANSGSVKLYGTPIEQFNEKHLIGYVPQRVSYAPLFPATVFEVVASGRTPSLGLFKNLGKHDVEAIEKAFKMAGIADLRDKLIGNLSGGQRQRVFIARALASEPKMLVLDEPSVGVDIASQQTFYTFLNELNTKHGITIIFVSHDIEVIANEVSCVLCLNRTLVCQGSPKKSFTPQNLQKLYGKQIKFVMHGHHHD